MGLPMNEQKAVTREIEKSIKNAANEQPPSEIQASSKDMPEGSRAVREEMSRLRAISETASECGIEDTASKTKRKTGESAQALDANGGNIKSVDQRLRGFKTS